ncbi:MAG: hypothetical protein ABIP51_11685 [Bacteroidia bacterium]
MKGKVKDKIYKVVRFDVYAQITKSKNEEKLRKIRWDYAGEYNDFSIKLFDTFCSMNTEMIINSYDSLGNRRNYKKSHVFGYVDIGYDMLKEELGLLREYHWDYIYFKIPITNEKLLNFFEEQKFSFNVKTVKTI